MEATLPKNRSKLRLIRTDSEKNVLDRKICSRNPNKRCCQQNWTFTKPQTAAIRKHRQTSTPIENPAWWPAVLI
jgi:hypothetical protein